jgi:hypothetical protein
MSKFYKMWVLKCYTKDRITQDFVYNYDSKDNNIEITQLQFQF